MGENIDDNISLEGIDIDYDYFLRENITSRFSFRHITVGEVQKIIKSMKSKTSSGFDNFSAKLMKSVSHSICYPLTTLINDSLRKGIFPKQLKIAKVVPLHKNGDKSNFENYRPVSLLPFFSKVYEKIVHKQINDYFDVNGLFFKSQHGFRSTFQQKLLQ